MKNLDPPQHLSSLVTKALQSDHNAQLYIAEALYFGIEMTRNINAGVKFYTKAAQGNLPDALCALGYFYEQGIQVSLNKKTSEIFYSKAKDTFYAREFLASPFSTEYFQFYRNARNNDPESQYLLAQQYYTGNKNMGIKKNVIKAIKWYTKAAEQGHSSAAQTLSFIYEEGTITSQDLDKAHYYSLKGNLPYFPHETLIAQQFSPPSLHKIYENALRGNSDDQYLLGTIYEGSSLYTIEPNGQLAITYYLKAAKQGNEQAYRALAKIYTKGRLVKKDIVQAEKYSKKANELIEIQTPIQPISNNNELTGCFSCGVPLFMSIVYVLSRLF